MLAWVLSRDLEGTEGGVLFLLLVAVTIAAAPISLLAVGVFSILEKMAPGYIPPDFYPTTFKGHFVVWWSIMFVLSYFQWFYIFPKIFRRKSGIG
jgi:hypothetical protein